MSGTKKTPSRRTLTRIASSSFIEDFALPSKVFCTRYTLKRFECFSLDNGHCSRCVRSGLSGCDVKMNPRSRRTIKEQEAALRQAQADVAEASARMIRLQKIVDNLKNKS